jgi:hypothetical protein
VKTLGYTGCPDNSSFSGEALSRARGFPNVAALLHLRAIPLLVLIIPESSSVSNATRLAPLVALSISFPPRGFVLQRMKRTSGTFEIHSSDLETTRRALCCDLEQLVPHEHAVPHVKHCSFQRANQVSMPT